MLGAASLLYSIMLQAAIPNTDYSPTSYVGTTGRFQISSPLAYNSAILLLGEGGPRNVRLNATLGWYVQDNQLLALSGEFLRQNITYSFFSGNTREWVKQGAVGAYYRYALPQYRFSPELKIGGGYSHAPNKNLSTLRGNFFQGNILTFYTDQRRIAGSDAYYFNPGIIITPWRGARVGAELNYDHVDYDELYIRNHDAEGLGGTLQISQQLGERTDLNLTSGFREPFNAYYGSINHRPRAFPNGSVGLFGLYVDGKHTLPDTYNIGVNVNYAIDGNNLVPSSRIIEKDGVKEGRLIREPLKPAIYLPQVLAIADERVSFISTGPTPPPPCIPPAVINTIPDQTIEAGAEEIIPTAQAFSGEDLSFSMEITGNPGPNTATIDPVTGEVTVSTQLNEVDNVFTLTVTATNECGTASTSFTVTVPTG